jgi:uncharacterized membrane protein
VEALVENVALVTFDDVARPDEAMSELRRLHDERAVEVHAAAIVERLDDGRFKIRDEAEQIGVGRSSMGAGLGLMLGALAAGPVGMLLGGAVGMAVGTASDVGEAADGGVLIATVSRRIRPGSTAVVADVDEPDPNTTDSAMAAIGATLHRFTRPEVEAELAEVDETSRATEG